MLKPDEHLHEKERFRSIMQALLMRTTGADITLDQLKLTPALVFAMSKHLRWDEKPIIPYAPLLTEAGEPHCVHCMFPFKEHPGGRCLFSPMAFIPCEHHLSDAVLAHLRARPGVIDAIKQLRIEYPGMGLAVAKNIVDYERERHGIR